MKVGPFTIEDLRKPFGFNRTPGSTAQPEKIGLELEFLPVRGERFASNKTLQALCEVPPYSGENSISSFLEKSASQYGWNCELEKGAIIALERGEEMITLEPSGVLEYVSPPLSSLAELSDLFYSTMAELLSVAEENQFALYSFSYHPFAKPEDLPLVPKARYETMYDYMPEVGTRGREMMKLCCATQVSLDFDSESDAIRKLRIANQITPFLVALSANSAFRQGALSGAESQRVDIWENTDSNRAGLLPFCFSPTASAEDYIEWALNAPVYFLKRGGELKPVLDKSFRELCEEGDELDLSLADWDLHLNTLFPWVRLKSFIEIRAFDGLPPDLTLACCALMTSLFYIPEKLTACEEAFGAIDFSTAKDLLERAGKYGLSDAEIHRGAQQLLEISAKPLQQDQANVEDNRKQTGWYSLELLKPLQKRVENHFVPSQLSLEETISSNRITI